MGMTMTTAFTIFAKKAVREYRIPFEISGDIPNAETMEAIQEVKQMKSNPSLGKTYNDVNQMMGELLSDV
jgi:DNA-damage-inducible protein J